MATYEQSYSFVAPYLTEQISSFSVRLSDKFDKPFSFLAGPASVYEIGNSFSALVSKVFEVNWSLRTIGYKFHEVERALIASAGALETEQALELLANALPRELFEQYVNLAVNARSDIVGKTVSAGTTVFVDGVKLEKTTAEDGTTGYISLSGGRNGYYNQYEIVIPFNAFARSVSVGAPVTIIWKSYDITSGGELAEVNATMDLFLDSEPLESSSMDESGGTRVTTLRCLSYSAGLDFLPGNRGAAPVYTVWETGTLASDIFNGLVGTTSSAQFDITDFSLAQRLEAGGRYPIEIITELFGINGTVILATDDGGILLTTNMPVPTALDLSTVIPDHDLELEEYMISSSDADNVVPVYNMITVSNVDLVSEVDLRPPEVVVDEDDSTKATVYGYRVPWLADFVLTTSHTVCADAVVSAGVYEEISVVTENIEFIDGSGSFPYPISSLTDVDWGCNRSLGTVTPSENGDLSAVIKENSLAVSVTCLVKRLVFQVTEYGGHNMQLWNKSDD